MSLLNNTLEECQLVNYSDNSKVPVLLIGVGTVALYVANQLHEYHIFGTTRSIDRLVELEQRRINPILFPTALDTCFLNVIQSKCKNAFVLVSLPPDGKTDRLLTSHCENAHKIVYISSTRVYGCRTGLIDESTAIDTKDKRANLRLAAEKEWQALGAVVLRIPAFYSSNYGLIPKLKSGTFRMTGNGSNYVSRIHLEDLARIIVASFKRASPSTIYVVGDHCPAKQIDVLRWLCNQMNIAISESTLSATVSHKLCGNRQIDGSKVLKDLQIELKYPSYREGFAACLIS